MAAFPHGDAPNGVAANGVSPNGATRDGVASTVPYGRKTQRAPDVKEVHIVWMTAGLGCDGDTISITAATSPASKT